MGHDRDHKKDKKPLGAHKNRVDYPRKINQEEYGAEVAPTNIYDKREYRHDSADRSVERSDDNTTGRTVGYIGLGLGIVSLFMWSIVLGPVAAAMGFYARSQGRKTAGAWAIGLGIVATISYLFLVMFR